MRASHHPRPVTRVVRTVSTLTTSELPGPVRKKTRWTTRTVCCASAGGPTAEPAMARTLRPLSSQLLEQFPFFITPRSRHHQSQCQQQITPSTLGRPTFALQTKASTRRCTCGDRHLRFTIGRHHSDGCSQRQLIEADGQISPELVILETPNRMVFDAQIKE